VSLSDAWSFDIPFAFRGAEFDRHFTKEDLVGKFFATLRHGDRPRELREHIHVDLEDRPKKTPRAFCAPVRVPDDVRLVIRPTGGWRDYDAFFHEGGHAWHFGSTKPGLAPEYRYLGDNSVTEASRVPVQLPPVEPSLAQERLGDGGAGGVREVSPWSTSSCSCGGTPRSSSTSSSSTAPRCPPSSRRSIGPASRNQLKFKHTEKHYLEDVDDGFYCAEYLRAWILEGQIRRPSRNSSARIGS